LEAFADAPTEAKTPAVGLAKTVIEGVGVGGGAGIGCGTKAEAPPPPPHAQSASATAEMLEK